MRELSIQEVKGVSGGAAFFNAVVITFIASIAIGYAHEKYKQYQKSQANKNIDVPPCAQANPD